MCLPSAHCRRVPTGTLQPRPPVFDGAAPGVPPPRSGSWYSAAVLAGAGCGGGRDLGWNDGFSGIQLPPSTIGLAGTEGLVLGGSPVEGLERPRRPFSWYPAAAGDLRPAIAPAPVVLSGSTSSRPRASPPGGSRSAAPLGRSQTASARRSALGVAGAKHPSAACASGPHSARLPRSTSGADRWVGVVLSGRTARIGSSFKGFRSRGRRGGLDERRGAGTSRQPRSGWLREFATRSGGSRRSRRWYSAASRLVLGGSSRRLRALVTYFREVRRAGTQRQDCPLWKTPWYPAAQPRPRRCGFLALHGRPPWYSAAPFWYWAARPLDFPSPRQALTAPPRPWKLLERRS